MKQLYSLLGIVISILIHIIPTDAQTDVPRYNHITIRGGDTVRTTCTMDGLADQISFRHVSYHYQVALLITNEQDTVEAVSIRSKFDFEGAEAGVCRVYSISYIGLLQIEPGESLDSIRVDGNLIGISSNYVTINRLRTIGGEVSDENGLDEVKICMGDENPDTILMTNNTTDGHSYVYLVTDTDNNILVVSTSPKLSFDEASPGECRVYGASYSGNLIAEPGINIQNVVISDECFEISSNYLKVVRIDAASLNPVVINSPLGDTIDICVGDRIEDIISWSAGFEEMLPHASYIITDDNKQILAFTEDESVDFESNDGGTCYVWAISYSGRIIGEIGNILDESILADHCYLISDNYITVNRHQVFTSSLATDRGISFQVCTSDGIPDSVKIQTDVNQGEYLFLITDSMGDITEIILDSIYDFNTISLTTTYVYGLSFTGEIPITIGDNINELPAGCMLLSDNSIEVKKSAAVGGNINTENRDSILLCAGNDVIITFNTDATGNAFYYYALVIGDSIIAEVQATTSSEEFPLGSYDIVGVAYATDKPFEVGGNLSNNLQGCYSISNNRIAITKKEVFAPSIQSNLGEEVFFCTGDGIPDSLFIEVSDIANTYAILITDDSLNIMDISNDSILDFEEAGEGVCLVWVVNYTGDLTINVGDQVDGRNLSTECFRLSEQAIKIIRFEPDGGTINTSLGDTIFICPSEGSTIDLSNNSTSLSNYYYVLIDSGGVVTWTGTSDLSAEDIQNGPSNIWGVSYTGMRPYEIGDTILTEADGCYSISGNQLFINKVDIQIPRLLTSFGDSIELCVGDGKPDFVTVGLSKTNGANASIVTDDSLNVLMITTDSILEFDQAGFGTCLVWGLEYTGQLIIETGDNLDNTDSLSTGCNLLSSHPITIIRSGLQPGLISSSVGDSIFLCAGNSNIENIQFSVDSSIAADEESGYIITGSADEVLAKSLSGSFDVILDVQGEVQVRQVFFRGDFTISIGDTLGRAELSSDCAALSENYISIFFSDPSLVEGGGIFSSMGDSIEICVGDGVSDFVSYSHQTSSESLYSYMVTEPGGKILAITKDTLINFEGVAPGECWIYGISHTVPVAQLQGRNLTEIFTEGCFSLSNNRITIFKNSVEQQIIEAPFESYDLCVGDGQDDWITFKIGEPDQAKQRLFITNEESIILDISDSLAYNFENSEHGTSWVWGVNFGGSLLLEVGDTLFGRTIADLCSALTSNFIEINKTGLESTSVMTVDGGDHYTACVRNNIADSLIVVNDGNNQDNYVYVALDTAMKVIALETSGFFNFDNLSPGTCFVRGLSFGGDLRLARGDTLSDTAQVASQCWIWSLNEITVDRRSINAGTILTQRGAISITLCNQNETPDVIKFLHQNADEGPQYAYIITDALDEILMVIEGDSMDFNDAPEGLCLVYGIAYEGALSVLPGENIFTTNLSTGCFKLTTNSIEVVRSMPQGGTVSTLPGADSVRLCLSDGVPDRVIFNSQSQSFARYTYILTDSNNVILEFLPIPAKDFSNSPPGVCRVWGLSYTGELIDTLVGRIDTLAFTRDCYELSDNYVTIIREESGPDCGLGLIDNPIAFQAKVFPSLVINELNVYLETESLENFNKRAIVEIMDISGHLVYRKSAIFNTNSNFQEKIDVRNFDKGMYVVKIRLENQIKSYKFIK